MLNIKILGPGCANCKRLDQIARNVIKDLAVQASIEKVTDYNEILTYDIMNTPGLVINGDVVCAGRLPSRAEVTTWVAAALETAAR